VIGQTLSRYEVLERIGEGEMGVALATLPSGGPFAVVEDGLY
jgi:hypothetical protein